MKITEMYKTARQNRVESDDIETLNKEGLTIHNAKIIGKTRMGILLSFKEPHLEHKCNRIDAFALAKAFETNESDEFEGKKVWFKIEENIVRITTEKPKKPKNNEKKK